MTSEPIRAGLRPCPNPLDWHPAYADKTWLLDWLNSDDTRIDMRVPRLRRRVWTADPCPTAPTAGFMTIVKHRCAGPAVYVGRPFLWEWWAGVDDVGRCIAGESRIRYLPDRWDF